MTWRAGRSPRRIAVLGCGGSGKTVLADRLGTMLGIPVTHLVQAHSQAWMSGGSTPEAREDGADR